MKKLKIIPLGGLGEVGKNMTVIEYGNEMVVVDVGLVFPDETMYGVDIVIPDFDYIRKNKNKFKGVFITHAHEDHIGALPHFLKEFNVPLYATKLTAAMISNKLKYERMKFDKINIINDEKETYQFDDINIEFFRTHHSIPDSMGIVVNTPHGSIVHTGDFKIDYTPVDKNYLDFQRIAEIGNKGVLALLSDSTNATKKGVSPSEREIKGNLRDEFAKCEGRIIVSSFSSSLHRVQSVMELAEEMGRKVVVIGKSMEKNVLTAHQIKHLNFPKELMVRAHEANDMKDSEVLIITTGAQGETLAGLNRMATGQHKHIELKEGDSVVFSSKPVPGNERSVSGLINRLLKKQVNVVVNEKIHTSGHGYQEEQKLMLSILRPKFFIPCHGEYRMLLNHAELAESVGIPRENIFLCENGDVIELSKEQGKIANSVKAGAVLIDNSGLGEVNTSVLKDRHRMAEQGSFFVSAIVFNQGKKKVKIKFDFKGIVARVDKKALNSQIKELILQKVKGSDDVKSHHREIREEIGDIIYKHVKRRPMVVFMLDEVFVN